MEIVQILTLKFKFLEKYLPKSYEMRMNQKKFEEKTKKSDGRILAQVLRVKDLEKEEAIPPEDRDKELEFYVETGRSYMRIENDRDHDISDLLKETKQLVQKMIALMQSVINTLSDSNKTLPKTENHLSEENLEQVSKLFHYGIKYFITKSAIYRLYGKNIQMEEEDLNKNVKLFMEIFMRLDLASFAQIMERQMGFLCKCITKPVAKRELKELIKEDKKLNDTDFLLKIPQYLKEELAKMNTAGRDKAQIEQIQSYSTAFAHILAKYLLKKLKNIGGYKKKEPDGTLDTQKYSKTLGLFKIVMDIFTHLEDNENIHVLYLNFIVLSAKYSSKYLLI